MTKKNKDSYVKTEQVRHGAMIGLFAMVALVVVFAVGFFLVFYFQISF